MRQKRQLFQKQIRRQTIQQIFKNNRKKYFNFSLQNELPKQTANQIKDQCHAEFIRYTNEIAEALRQENQNAICTAVKESSQLLKKLLFQAGGNADCLKFILCTWLNSGFKDLLFQSVKVFAGLGKNVFSSMRKETFKWAVYHFYQVFEYQSALESRNDSIDDMFSFLFLAIVELQNEPESLRQIIVLLNSILFSSVQTRHKFFFHNSFTDSETNFQKICFQHVISAMFQNKDRLRLIEGSHQVTKFIEIKLFFIELFKLYCYQLQDIEKYVKNRNQLSQKKIVTNSYKITEDLYEETLKRAKDQNKIWLKSFLDKAHITIIYEVIKEMKSFNFDYWAEDSYYQDNLTNSLEAFRLFLEFYPSKRIIKQFENELDFLLSLLISKDINVMVKNETINLIDMIVYLDEENETTDFLIRHQDLFQRVWSYEEPNILHIKLNILNNLLLTSAGFDVAMKYINEISIVLMETKHVSLALTFCQNFFLRTEYKIDQNTKFTIVINILYSLPEDKFDIKDIEHDFHILAHLYENGLCKDLPYRYYKWEKEAHLLNDRLTTDFSNEKTKYLMSEKNNLVDRLFLLRNQYLYNSADYMDD